MTECATKENTNCKTHGDKKPCNWKGKILGFLVFFAVSFLVGHLVWGELYLDVWSSEQYSSIMRPMDDSMWQYMPLAYAIYAYAFIVLFHKFSFSICSPCGTNFGRGAMFGLYIWLIVGLMPAAFMLIVHPVNFDYVQIHLVDTLITLLIGGGLVGLVFRTPYCPKACKAEATE